MKGKKRIRRPTSPDSPTKTLYFGPDVQDSIVSFKAETDLSRREATYINEILPAFNKLAENLIYIYGFAGPNESVSDLRSDCVCFLYENLHKFDESRGTKAFSYFNVVARNWLIIHAKKRQKMSSKYVSIDDIESLSAKDRKAIAYHSIIESPDEILYSAGQRQRILDAIVKIKSMCTNDQETACADAIHTVFSRIDDLDLLSKRAIFVYVRDISNLNAKQLAGAMAAIRRYYKELIKDGVDIL
jgi:hypothetical protein